MFQIPFYLKGEKKKRANPTLKVPTYGVFGLAVYGPLNKRLNVP